MTRHDPPELARRRFYEAALRVCSEKGYHATRMDDIAAAAGRSKGAIYHHFSSKKELFVEMTHDFVDSFSSDVEQSMDPSTSVRDLFDAIVMRFAEEIGTPQMFSVFLEIMPLAARDPELRVPLSLYYAQAVEALAGLLSWGQQRGELRGDFDPLTTARILALGGDGIFLVAAALGEDDALDEVRTFFHLVLDGLRP